MGLGELGSGELFWREHYYWLRKKGYELRSRYHPDWVPAWKVDKKLPVGLTEDSKPLANRRLNDAIRISDRKHVVLKHVPRAEYPTEASISMYFSKADVSSFTSNHCVPVLQRLQPPGIESDILVLPLLRSYDSPEFATIGEAVDFIRQILTGFAFVHLHRVAHKDVRVENIMMDCTPLGFDDFHFLQPGKSPDLTRAIRAKFTRTEKPPKYYIIDFGFSKQYSVDEMPPSECPRPASDDSLPELKDLSTPCNPFPCDVYYVGNMIRMDFIDGHPTDNARKGRQGFEFLRPLTDAMTKENPDDRITMDEAVAQFEALIKTLSAWKLRSRIVMTTGEYIDKLDPFEWVSAVSTHWYKRVKYTLLRLPPVPSPANDLQRPSVAVSPK